MNVEHISIETDDRGFELHVLTTDKGRLILNIQNVAEDLYNAVCSTILPWLAEGAEARREYDNGRSTIPELQPVLTRVRELNPEAWEGLPGYEHPDDVEPAKRDGGEWMREQADHARKAAKENPR